MHEMPKDRSAPPTALKGMINRKQLSELLVFAPLPLGVGPAVSEDEAFILIGTLPFDFDEDGFIDLKSAVRTLCKRNYSSVELPSELDGENSPSKIQLAKSQAIISAAVRGWLERRSPLQGTGRPAPPKGCRAATPPPHVAALQAAADAADAADAAAAATTRAISAIPSTPDDVPSPAVVPVPVPAATTSAALVTAQVEPESPSYRIKPPEPPPRNNAAASAAAAAAAAEAAATAAATAAEVARRITSRTASFARDARASKSPPIKSLSPTTKAGASPSSPGGRFTFGEIALIDDSPDHSQLNTPDELRPGWTWLEKTALASAIQDRADDGDELMPSTPVPSPRQMQSLWRSPDELQEESPSHGSPVQRTFSLPIRPNPPVERSPGSRELKSTKSFIRRPPQHPIDKGNTSLWI